MNVPRVVLASVGGFVAYFAFGGLVLGPSHSSGRSSKNTRPCTGRTSPR